MIETKTKQINGHAYQVTQFKARKAIHMKVKIAKYFGGPISALIANGKSMMDKDISDPEVIGVIARFASSLEPDVFVDMALELLGSTFRDNKMITEDEFDSVYANNFSELYQALYFVLIVNYKDFFLQIPTMLDAGH